MLNSIFSSVAGRIKILLMAVPNLSDQAQIDRIDALQKVLQNDTGLVIWCNCVEDRDQLWQIFSQNHGVANVLKGVAEMPLPERFRILLVSPAEASERYSHWVRDPFICFHSGKQSFGVIKSKAAQVEDQNWSEKYIGKLNIENVTIRTNDEIFLPAAGGNVLFDQDIIFIGYHQISSCHTRLGRQVVDDFIISSLGGKNRFKRVINIGEKAAYEPERLRHIDLYLSLTGMNSKENGKYIVLLGECFILNDDHQANTDTENLVTGINRYLSMVMEQLLAEGLEVIRTPMPLIGKKTADKCSICYYNNCLVSNTPTDKIVWLPAYSHGVQSQDWYEAIKIAEERNASVWQALGYEVRFVEADFHSIADDIGSLHCITHEILRG